MENNKNKNRIIHLYLSSNKSNQFLKALHSNIVKSVRVFFYFAESYLAKRLIFVEADRLHTSFHLAGLD